MIDKIDLFSCLDEEGFKAIRAIADERSFHKNQILIQDGDRSGDLFLLLKGDAQAVSTDASGKRYVLNRFKAGQYFGEMSFIDGQPRCASVVAITACRAMIIPRDKFRNLFPRYPELCFKILKGINDKLRKATDQIEDLVFRDVYQRVARFITQNTRLHGKLGEDHVTVTHLELAEMVGSSREMVTRVLKEIANKGHIVIKRGKIQIIKHIPYDHR